MSLRFAFAPRKDPNVSPSQNRLRTLEAWLVTVGLPVGLALTLGPAIALLIAMEQWILALAIVIVVPAVPIFIRYPFVAIPAWLLVSPFVQVTPTYTGRYIFWLVHRAIIPLALAVALVSRWVTRDKSRPLPLGRAELSQVVFLALVVISILLEDPISVAKLINVYDRILIPFLVYLLIQFTVPGERDLKRLMPALWVVCVAECVIGIMSWYVPHLVPPAWLTLQGQRTTGTFDEPAFYTIALNFGMLFLLQYGIHLPSNSLRRILFFTFALGAGGIFLSFSRGSWLAGLLVGLILLALYPKIMLRLYTGILVFVVILSISTGLLTSYSAWASERLEDKGTTDSRLGEARASLRMIQSKPLFGWGYENFDRYDSQFLSVEDEILLGYGESTSHNTFLTIIAEMGLVGFLIFHFPYFWWLVLNIRIIRRMPRDGFWSWRLLVLLWSVILFYVTVASFVDMRFSPFALTLTWLALGLIASIVRTYLQQDDVGAPAWAVRAARSSR